MQTLLDRFEKEKQAFPSKHADKKKRATRSRKRVSSTQAVVCGFRRFDCLPCLSLARLPIALCMQAQSTFSNARKENSLFDRGKTALGDPDLPIHGGSSERAKANRVFPRACL